MTKQLPNHPLFDALRARASLQDNIKKLQDDINRSEQCAINALYEVLPNNGTRLFVDIQGVIQDLVRTGFHFAHFMPESFVMTSGDIDTILTATSLAWKGVVEIERHPTQEKSLIVTFKAVTP